MTGKAQRPSKYKITEQISTTGTKSLHQQNCLKLTALTTLPQGVSTHECLMNLKSKSI